MEKTTLQNVATHNISSQQLKTQLASYLEEQPENIRSLHRVMKVLESITLGIIILIFITALVLSFMWKTIPAGAIPAVWFLLPTSVAGLMLLIAVHSLSLHAYPPSSLYSLYQGGSPARLFGKYQQFVTGKAADTQGCDIDPGGTDCGCILCHLRLGILDGQLGDPYPHDQYFGCSIGDRHLCRHRRWHDSQNLSEALQIPLSLVGFYPVWTIGPDWADKTSNSMKMKGVLTWQQNL